MDNRQHLANNLKPHTIEITKPMLKASRSAHSSYKIHLEEEKKKIYLSERENQALHIPNDIEKLKLLIKQREKAVKMMDDEFVECARLAEEKNDMSFVFQGNGLKRKSDKTKEEIASLEEAIGELQNKKMKLTN